MIVARRPSWRMVFRYTWQPVAIVLVLSLSVAGAVDRGFQSLSMPGLPLAMVGTALSIFLGFRTNAAYGRWWEARTLWGALVNNSRTLARQALTFSSEQDPAAARAFERDLVHLQIAFVNALRCHLRRQDPWSEMQRILAPEQIAHLRLHTNVPAAILLLMGARLKQAFRDGLLEVRPTVHLDETLVRLTDILGGCERIRNTPVPRQYDFVPWFFVRVFCLLLPFGLVGSLGWATPMPVLAVALLFIWLDEIGRAIEDPFNNDLNDTPMTALCRTIEMNLRQSMSERETLPVPDPVDGVLM